MADKKKAPPRTKNQKPNPHMLGSGFAGKAANTIAGRRRTVCEATGGSYDPTTGRCK